MTTGLDSPLDCPCARCGKPVSDDRRPFSLSAGKPVHRRCWPHEWNDIGETYVATFGTEDRGPFTLDAVAPFDDPEKDDEDEKKRRRKDPLRPWDHDTEFMCSRCTQLRPNHQHHDGDCCADCWDAGAPRPYVVVNLPRYRDTFPWWHCEVCRTARLAALIHALEFARLESKRFYQVDRLAVATRLPKEAQKRWADLRWQWSALCPLCGLERRGEAWVLRERAHQKCWDNQRRRKRRRANPAIKSRSMGANNKPVVHIWENGIRGEEPSVAAVNGSAGAPPFVSPRTQYPAYMK